MGLGWVSLAIRLFSKVLALARFGLVFLEKGKGKWWSKKKGDLLGHVEDNVLKYIRCKETMGLGWVSLAIRLSPKVLALARFGLVWLEKGKGKGGQREREKMPKYATKPSKNR